MDVGAVIGAILGLAGGGILGFLLGRRFRSRCSKGAFWGASAAALVLGGVVILLGEIAGATFFAGGGIGIVTGGINGLRWGMGRLTDNAVTDAGAPACEKEEEARREQRRRQRAEDRRPHPAG